MYEKAIKNATTENFRSDRPDTLRQDDGELSFPEDQRTSTYIGYGGDSDDYIRGYERYYKEIVDYYRVFQRFDGKEEFLTKEDFEEYLERPAFVFQDMIITDAKKATQLMQAIQQKFAQELEQAKAQGIPDAQQPQLPEMQQIKIAPYLTRLTLLSILLEIQK